ncbi:MAG: dephospho-CoA kinase [Gammaproteobacteria bacterium]|nr:MAG: dephospho-CoA kinase [Gammaproteobacteria bacterium]
MLRVGLTGGIGSGKSTVAALFARHGAPIIDTDEIAHELLAPGQAAHAEIVAAFGQEILDSNGNIDRTQMRHRVFAEPAERKRLEAILHPRIRAETARRLAGLRAPYCLVAVPLLIEAGFTDLVDRVLVIDADDTLRIQRTKARSGLGEAEIRRIMASQASRQERLQKADDIITNNSDLAHLEREVARLHGVYSALAPAGA